MIRSRILSFTLCALAASALTACDGKLDVSALDSWMPGKPKREDAWKPETAITSGEEIFAQNCLGCHSIGGTPSPSIAMSDPLYLAVIPPEILKSIIANGIKVSSMPAFSEEHGGSLTPEQIEKLVAFILEKKKPIDGPLPAYAAPAGNAAAGQIAFETYFSKFPGMTGYGSISDPAFLGLVTDQYIRTLVIAGRPELGLPDYRSRVPGKAMSDQEIADVVAWLISQRRNEFGQPLTTTNP
ncbi:MAG TPA: cytochrome c [Chthoniobacterales bacterium]